MTTVRFARRTLRELDRIEAWCRANQPLRWSLFTAELEQAVRLLRVIPHIGHPYELGGADVRRVLLSKTQHYVYYRCHTTRNLIVILSIWSTRRRRPPAIR